jgi:hypothetical protein
MSSQQKAAKAKLATLESQAKDLEASVPQAILIAEKQVEAAKAASWRRISSLLASSNCLKIREALCQKEILSWLFCKEINKLAESLKAEAALIKTRLDMNASLEKALATVESARSDLNKVEKGIR